ncbi:MAG: tetratricopeptide repeat protein [Acidobacteria bacterium]|nr:tetratricopeptide repeat protein [Acidobacteriota bacterium]
MRFNSALIPALILASAVLPKPGGAVNKEHEAIMREIQALSAEVQKLQKLDERVLELRLLLQQTLDMATKANTAVTVLERDMKERMREQEKTLVAPVAGLGTKVDQMADEFRFVKENVAEVNSRMGKLQGKLVDVENSVNTVGAQIRTSQAPPPAPVEPPKPTVDIGALMEGAHKDTLGTRYDLALAAYDDVRKHAPKSEEACQADYYSGDIYYRKEDWMKALSHFDDVLEKYDEACSKAPDALYMKARTLAKGGQRTAAGGAYRELKTKYPQRNWIDKANAGLRELGLSTGAPAASNNRKKR